MQGFLERLSGERTPPQKGAGLGSLLDRLRTGQEPLEDTALVWQGNGNRHFAERIIREGLRPRGRFISAGGAFYFFDARTKLLHAVDSFSMAVLLREDFKINQTESIYNYLIKDMAVEAAVRGEQGEIMEFAYYSPEDRHLYLDLGAGRMLKLDGRTITEVDNGQDGVLFAVKPLAKPWTFQPGVSPGLFPAALIEDVNFADSEHSPLTPDEQRLLLLAWSLCLAFESLQPTKPLALAVGPSQSGKSMTFRRIGQCLIGPDFEVDDIPEELGKDFRAAITNNRLLAFDNVDRYVKGLEDALARAATGVQFSLRKYFSTNELEVHRARVFLALTARTPRFRREDVASRCLIFYLERRDRMPSERELLARVQAQRSTLMSSYAALLNRVLAAPDPVDYQSPLRLADFARVAMWISRGLGLEGQMESILAKMKNAQFAFATEEHELTFLLGALFDQPADGQQGVMVGADTQGVTREYSTIELHKLLTGLAKEYGVKWYYDTPVKLGIELKNLKEALADKYILESRHTKRNRGWRITQVSQPE